MASALKRLAWQGKKARLKKGKKPTFGKKGRKTFMKTESQVEFKRTK